MPQDEVKTPRLHLDPLDLRIPEALQTDAGGAKIELAAEVGLSASPCLARVRAL